MVVTTVGRNQEKYFLYRYSEYRTVDRSVFGYPKFVQFLIFLPYKPRRIYTTAESGITPKIDVGSNDSSVLVTLDLLFFLLYTI
jgi:hypothetical protein